MPKIFAVPLVFRALRRSLVQPEVRSIAILLASHIGSGMVVFHLVEKWRWLDSFYFSVVTLTTVGYGDFTPKTDVGKLYAVFFLLTGMGLFAAFVTQVGEQGVALVQERRESHHADA